MIKCGIYRIVDENGREYVGSTNDFETRENKHFSDLKSNRHVNNILQNAYNKYGREFFCFEPLLLCLEEDLLIVEQNLLDNVELYYNINMIAGKPPSPKGLKRSKETRKKISESQIGRKLSEKTKKKISEARKGYVFTEQHKRKIKENHRGFSGKKHNKETKNRFRKAYSKPINQLDLDTGEIINTFPSIKSASKSGFDIGCIVKVCQGKRKTHKGFRWEYLEKE